MVGVSAPLTPVHRPHALRLLLQLPLVESPALGLSGLLSMHGFHASSICRFYEPLMVLLKVRGLQADTKLTPPLSAVSAR
jgi:hypothetical protein